ncbi:hypothetical protein RHGRI_012616 [Rhododendron griersonianum]|uniref:Secreted protein n=1 Tax=Rhododendron griersonianum TaxID=479676 RepID=A0AAV6KRU9_9ERIC|nr:hypothetical protein RHGRI_012616 [Rhododendron griersonianum]
MMLCFCNSYCFITLGSSVATNNGIFSWGNHRPKKWSRATMLSFLVRWQRRQLLLLPSDGLLQHSKAFHSNLNKICFTCHGNSTAHKLWKTLEICSVC